MRNTVALSLLGLAGFHASFQVKQWRAKDPIDFTTFRPTRIVIVGAGFAGTVAAYYLSNHKDCHVTLLERHSEPFQGSSNQTGNFMTTDWAATWLNFPVYPKLCKAIFDSKDYPSKVYVGSLFESVESLMSVFKFGYAWLFWQRKPEELNTY
jgi:hypothetical protein